MGAPKQCIPKAEQSFAGACASAVKDVINNAGKKIALEVAECVETMASWEHSPYALFPIAYFNEITLTEMNLLTKCDYVSCAGASTENFILALCLAKKLLAIGLQLL